MYKPNQSKPNQSKSDFLKFQSFFLSSLMQDYDRPCSASLNTRAVQNIHHLKIHRGLLEPHRGMVFPFLSFIRVRVPPSMEIFVIFWKRWQWSWQLSLHMSACLRSVHNLKCWNLVITICYQFADWHLASTVHRQNLQQKSEIWYWCNYICTQMVSQCYVFDRKSKWNVQSWIKVNSYFKKR